MNRRTTTLAASLAVLAAGACPAEAAELAAPGALARDCTAQPVTPGARGVARTAWRAPAAGIVDIGLAGGPHGDWDLAVFHPGEDHAFAASTNFGSDERVTAFVRRGERLTVQGCRRDALARRRVPLSVRFVYQADLPKVGAERASLESVAISGPEDLARLEALGLDVTHDVSATDATVAAYSDAERALLVASGFATRTVVHNLAVAQRAGSARALRGSAGLPSGRTSYREYADFTTEMKDLADENPQIAREVTIGSTLEGRPIQGLEIAGDVDATDDGRPVYLNMGVHHAREWPSGEFPMEFAIDLVEGYGTDTRITNLLDDVRVFIFPVINVDGYLVSRAGGAGEYRRKNCRPLNAAEALIPCAARGSAQAWTSTATTARTGADLAPRTIRSPRATGGPAPTPSPSRRRSTSSLPGSTRPCSSRTTPTRTTASGCASRGSRASPPPRRTRWR